jgi:hypothetical protein
MPSARGEALALLTDLRIGWDRCVLHALQFFTGMRIGETCGRRWRDWSPDAKPLGSLLEQITHNARGALIDVYTSWEWPALCEAVSCLKVDPERLPGRIYDISYDISVSENANPRQSLRLFGGGGGNRTLLSAIRSPYADTRFSRVSLSKACNPSSCLRTLQYPGIPRLALGSGHHLVAEVWRATASVAWSALQRAA